MSDRAEDREQAANAGRRMPEAGETRPDAGEAPADQAPADQAPAVEAAEGGDSACWAHLVCPECGAMSREGHRPGCELAPAGP
jgi:hypothetical protein